MNFVHLAVNIFIIYLVMIDDMDWSSTVNLMTKATAWMQVEV